MGRKTWRFSMHSTMYRRLNQFWETFQAPAVQSSWRWSQALWCAWWCRNRTPDFAKIGRCGWCGAHHCRLKCFCPRLTTFMKYKCALSPSACFVPVFKCFSVSILMMNERYINTYVIKRRISILILPHLTCLSPSSLMIKSESDLDLPVASFTHIKSNHFVVEITTRSVSFNMDWLEDDVTSGVFEVGENLIFAACGVLWLWVRRNSTSVSLRFVRWSEDTRMDSLWGVDWARFRVFPFSSLVSTWTSSSSSSSSSLCSARREWRLASSVDLAFRARRLDFKDLELPNLKLSALLRFLWILLPGGRRSDSSGISTYPMWSSVPNVSLLYLLCVRVLMFKCSSAYFDWVMYEHHVHIHTNMRCRTLTSGHTKGKPLVPFWSWIGGYDNRTCVRARSAS